VTPWQYFALAGFGAFHGLSPGMGWLVALAAGVRERSRIVLSKTLIPIASGHALSVFTAAFLVTLLRSVVTTQVVAIVGGCILVTVGVWRAFSRRHEHGMGFQLSNGQLVGWSFLMSSVHGAGLALLPILVATPVAPATLGGHVHGEIGAQTGVSLWIGVSATAVHTLAMVAVTGGIALIAFQLTSLPVLRIESWFHLDRVWALALIGSGVATVTLALIP
jgi:hypothetical protein